MSRRAVVVFVLLIVLVGLYLFISAPGTMGPPWQPWQHLNTLVAAAVALAAPLIVAGLAGLAAGAILGVADRRPS